MQQFRLIDQILELDPGKTIKAVKHLGAEEDYLKDHFPLFPVMPGVLMLEAMYQTAAWLVRRSENFEHAAVLLREARNIKYSDFVAPGQTLVVTAEILKQDAATTTLKAQATVEERVAVSGRLVLERFQISDRFPQRGRAADSYCISQFRDDFQRLTAAK